jgi:hypothetical protein
MSGHRLLVSSPSAETNSEDDRAKITNAAFSILDAETGRVLRSVVGPNPDKGAPFNVALHAAVSPDEKLLAIVFRSTAKQMAAAIYSTENGQRIASANFPSDEFEFETRSLAFSPDGKLLAILNGLRGRVLLFDTTSWNLLQSFDAFPDTAPPLHVVIGGALAFSPNNKMLAVASFGGGSWWHDKNGALSTEGSGSLVPEFPADPLRVFDVASGTRIKSLGLFPAGFFPGKLAWLPNSDRIVFLDGLGNIRFWNPLTEAQSTEAARMGRHGTSIVVSADGSKLAANFPAGVKIFNIIKGR